MNNIIKKLIVLCLFIALMCGCNQVENKTNVTKLQDHKVQVVLPLAMFQGYSNEQIIDEALKQGVEQCIVEEEVTYIMSEEFHSKMLGDLHTSIDETIQMIHDQDLSIKAITYSQDFKVLKIRVASDQSYGYENIYAVNLVTLMSYYQMFYGYEDKIDIICEIYDETNNELITSFDYDTLNVFASSLSVEQIEDNNH